MPEGADRLAVVVLVREFAGDSVKIYNPTYTEIKKYEPRMVRVASLDVTPKLPAGIIPGEDIVTYDADFGRIGFAICWDLFFPEFVGIAARDGVEILLNPTLGYHLDQNSMRAQDTGCYIVSSGNNFIVMSPFKRDTVIADAQEKGYAVADIDLNYRYLVPRLSAPSAAERPNVIKHETNYKILKKYR